MRTPLLAALMALVSVPAWAQHYPSPTNQNHTVLGNQSVGGTSTMTGGVTGTTAFGKGGGGEVQVQDTGSQLAGTVLNVPTFSDLRAFIPDALNKTKTAHTEGFATAGDGGGATYDWDSTNTCNVNSGNVVCVLPVSGHTTTGRWRLRMTTGGVDVRVNGAKCDGVTDDSSAINNLITNVSQFGGGDVVIPVSMAASGVSGCVVSGANLLLKSGVRLRGAFNPFSGPQGFAAYANSSLLLDPSKSIVVAAGSAMSDLLVWRLGLAAKPTNVSDIFAAITQWQADNSTAITVTSSSTIERVRVIGFTLAFKQTGGGNNWLRDVQFDGINGFERIAANAVTNLDNMQANSWWASGFGGRQGVTSATPTAGTGYATGNTVQPSGGTCTVRPTFTVTASGGVPGALAITDPGDCTVLPTGATFTGGAGTGLTATMLWRSGGYRPGIGVYDHEGIELLMTGGLFEQFATAIKVSNSSLNVFTNVMIEGAGSVDFQSVGFDAENCSENSIVNSTVTANWTNILANAKTDLTAATCNVAGGNNNTAGVTKIYGGHLNGAQNITNSSIVVGPSASLYVSGTRIGSGNLSSAANVTVAAGGQFTASGLVLMPFSNHNPWITADTTATLNICGGLSDGSAALSTIGYWETCRQQTAPPTKTGTAYAVLSTDTTLVLNPSNTFTLTLPSAATFPGKVLTLKTIANFAINSAASNVSPLTSATPSTAILAATAGKWVLLQSDGSNWVALEGN